MEQGRKVNQSRFTAETIMAMVIGFLLMGLCLPRTIASVLMTPTTHVAYNLKTGGAVSQEELDIMIASYSAAAGWSSSGEIWRELGMAQSWLAYLTGYNTQQGEQMLAQSINSTQAGLSLSPANTFAWSALAHAYFARTGYALDRIKESLMLSIQTSAYEPVLLFKRLSLCLRLFPYFNDDDKRTIQHQIQFALSKNYRKLGDVALISAAYKQIIERSVEKDSEKYKWMQAYLKRKSGGEQ